MNNTNLKDRVINATKWSSFTEIIAKLISPVTNMILARILAPEAFGVVATVTMIISFADMFTDSGFQKYLVQHEFKDESEKYKNANVAFWTNFGISVLFWIIIIIFREQLATLVGNPRLGNVIAISCFQLLLTSFSSIQMALFRRDLDFKTLFLVRVVSVFIPFVITIPLALLGLNYWALIIGTLVIRLSNAVILTIKSKWKPRFFYSIKILKEMFSFSIWSLIEAISIWLTSWVDTFIISSFLNQYYLGIYKTSTSMVNALMALVTASIVPVLFSTLSRFQEDDEKFNHVFFKFQRLVSIIVFPMGIGVYLYSDLATKILLGSQWHEANKVIGVWALTSSITIVFSYFNSEAYRAKGRPKLSFISQLLHLIFLVPTCIVSAKYGFWALVYARSLIRTQGILVGFIIMNKMLKIPILNSFKNVYPTAVSSVIMGIFGYLLQQISNCMIWSLISIVLCAVLYVITLSLFPNMRKEVIILVTKLLPKRLMHRFNLHGTKT